LMFPVDRPAHKERVLRVLRSMFQDNVKARWLRADGTYERRSPAPGEAPFRVQYHLQEEARRQVALARGRGGIVLQPEQADPGMS
jgi:polyphosphate kinase